MGSKNKRGMMAVFGTIAAVLIPGCALTPKFAILPPATRVVEYHKEVEWGETLWDICSNVATDETDLRLLVWQAKRDNRIEDPTKLQPGTEIIIRVPERRK